MNKKRLIRDLWGFQYFPYYQMRIDHGKFHGWAALNELTDGDYQYWDFKKAGKTPVAGKGMCWLTLIPDGKKAFCYGDVYGKRGNFRMVY